MAADLLGLFEEHGLRPKKKTGKEWGAACPACGGKDRCSVWPDDHDGRGGYHCRQCGAYGDNIQFLRDYKGLSYQDACRELGVTASRATAALPKPPRKPAGQDPFESAPSVPPAEAWAAKAWAFCSWAHQHLLNNPEQLRWLADRGLPLEAVKRYRLGWNPGERGKSCLIRPRALWGLPPVEPKRDTEGNPLRPKTTFWLPRGLVIPMLDPVTGQVLRLRIRRPDADRQEFKEETKYYVIPGSCMDAMILGADARAFVVVESELDALMLHHQAGDLAGAVSVMTANVKKIESGVLDAISRALAILVALDFDGAGATGWTRWSASFPHAKRWPCPAGKDPGEAYALKANLRAWIMAGLPPVLQPGLLPPGKPVLGGEGHAEQGEQGAVSTPRTGLSAPEADLSAVGAPNRAPVAESSTPLPRWMEPLSDSDLRGLGDAYEPLLELCSLMSRHRVAPVLLVYGEGGEQDEYCLALSVPGEVILGHAEDWARLQVLFFSHCLEAVLWLAVPSRIRGERSYAACRGYRDHQGEWGVVVTLAASGMTYVGWALLDHWRGEEKDRG